VLQVFNPQVSGGNETPGAATITGLSCSQHYVPTGCCEAIKKKKDGVRQEFPVGLGVAPWIFLALSSREQSRLIQISALHGFHLIPASIGAMSEG
jgi:hypothetical protein